MSNEPETDTERPRELRRIARLFRPYRARLSRRPRPDRRLGLASGSPRRSCCARSSTTAIPQGDTALLTLLVLGMIGVVVATGVLGVAQTLISNVVGQRVMHDLRTAVYRHLQRMSLAFFTRTRTGEVQSRIANDIGGVQNVVTCTATSIVSNVTTVIATIVAMFALDWRLAAFSLVLLPVFVWITRRVGSERKKITTERQGRLADMSLARRGVALRQRHPARQDDGPRAELADRFQAESAELADLEVRSRMAGRWRMSSVADELRRDARARLLVRRPEHRPRRRRDLDRHARRVHHAADAAAVPDPARCCNVGVDMQTSLALFHRIFEYLDLPVDIAERADPVELGPGRARGEVRFEDVAFALRPRRRRRRSHDIDIDGAAGRARRDRRRDRLRQDDARLPRRAPVRRRPAAA